MTITYSEARQRILFKAARDMRAVAAQVLDDMQNEVECSSGSSVQWAKRHARNIAEQANELETQGHEQCIASGQAEAANRRSKAAYSRSIDAFEKRIIAAGGPQALKELLTF